MKQVITQQNTNKNNYPALCQKAVIWPGLPSNLKKPSNLKLLQYYFFILIKVFFTFACQEKWSALKS